MIPSLEGSSLVRLWPSILSLVAWNQGFIARDTGHTRVIPATKYLIVQTSMPAVYVHPSSLKNLNPAHLRSEAYNILCGILKYYLGGKKEQFYEVSGMVSDSHGRPLEGVIITLNDCLEIQGGNDGRYRIYIPKTDDIQRLLFTKTGFKPKEINIEISTSFDKEMDVVLER